MLKLKPITPLGADELRVDRFTGLMITEVTDRALVSLTARNDQADATRDKAWTLFGIDLPDVGTSAMGNTHSAFWIGPESWMIDAPYEGNEDLARQVKHAMGDCASVVEQTDGWCRFDLGGVASNAVLERLCNADSTHMAEGAVTRTQIHHLGCFLWCREDGFAVIGPRSSAASLHHALMQAAQSTC